MEKDLSINSSVPRTGKDLLDVLDMETFDTVSNCLFQNVKDDTIQSKKDLEKANICRIYKDSFKMDSVPPVPSLLQLGKLVDYGLVKYILCYDGRLNRYNSLWCCAFEPDTNDSRKTTYISAICGGESIHLVNCLDGMLVKNKRFCEEDFRVLAWTTVKLANGQMLNLLAAGGKQKKIRLFHSHYLVNYTVLNGHTDEISCLTFHPSKPTVLCSGDRQANICVWDINVPSKSKYYHYLLMRLKCPRPSLYPVLDLVIMPNYDTLLASCGDGIFAWTIKDFRRLHQADKRSPAMMEIKIPTSRGPWFDGLARLSENLVVVNSVEEGEIYVFDFGKLLLNCMDSTAEGTKVVTAEVLGKMLWSEKEDIYINITARPGLGAVVCGNSKGSIWLYDLQKYIVNKESYQKFNTTSFKKFGLNYAEIKPRKAPSIMAKKIAVTSADISSDGKCVVYVTDEGHICVWRFLG